MAGDESGAAGGAALLDVYKRQHPVLAEQLTRIFDRQVSPQRAWKVSLDEHGAVWTDGTQTFRKEPEAPASRRAMSWLMKVLPVESQL